jgi:hypothetical protein
VTAMAPQKLTSNMSFAVGISVSKAGMTYATPELFTRKSSLPLVFVLMSSTAAEMLEGTVTSRVKRVTFGRAARCDNFCRERAEAKMCMLRLWKASTRADPMPPALQPVIRTDFCDMFNKRSGCLKGGMESGN